MDVVMRSDILTFYGVPGESGEYTFYRMKGFSDLSNSKNAKEYSRQYVDEAFEQTDVVGYSPSMSFTFDRMRGDAVHDDIITIYNEEKLGSDAVRPIIVVDTETKEATRRDFAVIADGEGSGTEAFVYSGTFRSRGDRIKGSAETEDDWQTITFMAEISGE